MQSLCRPVSRYDFIRDSLESYGYNVCAALLDTADFGPAQSRHRAWIIAGLGCDAMRAISDAASLRCQTWPLSLCLPKPVLAPEVHKGKKRKQSDDAKWMLQFERLREEYGKAGLKQSGHSFFASAELELVSHGNCSAILY